VEAVALASVPIFLGQGGGRGEEELGETGAAVIESELSVTD
jgi:hypothetical protein